jgi:hypothetical protein
MYINFSLSDIMMNVLSMKSSLLMQNILQQESFLQNIAMHYTIYNTIYLANRWDPLEKNIKFILLLVFLKKKCDLQTIG